MDKLLLRVPEVSDVLGLSVERTYQEVRAGNLPVVRIGRATRIPAAAVLAWVSARTETWGGEPWPGASA